MSFHLDCGNTLQLLPAMWPESVHTVVTSPPYWGLRDYGLEADVWGGKPDCDHAWLEQRYYVNGGAAGVKSNDVFFRAGKENAARLKKARWRRDSFCVECGAWCGCLGLEPTPELYVEHIVQIFRQVWRVLRKDGTLWLNMGDSYATKPIGSGSSFDPKYRGARDRREALTANRTNRPESIGLKHKDLVGMPWRVAFALQLDGWHLRMDNIWFKKNPMPESVEDRCTKAHEYIFQLGKRARYYFDNEAIKELSSENSHTRGGGVNPKATREGQNSRMRANQDPRHLKYEKEKRRNFDNGVGWGRLSKADPTDGRKDRGRVKQNPSFSAAVNDLVTMRNKRSVWEVVTSPFRVEMCLGCRHVYLDGFHGLQERCKDCKTKRCECPPKLRHLEYRCAHCQAWDNWLSHIATFPPEIPEICIRAGTSERGCCAKCGASWKRITKKATRYRSGSGKAGTKPNGKQAHLAHPDGNEMMRSGPVNDTVTVGWRATCKCEAAVIPCTVLDIFSGAATTGLVAVRLGRYYIGHDRREEFIHMSRVRIESDAPLFNVAPAPDEPIPQTARLFV